MEKMLYLGLCYYDDQGYTDYRGTNEFVKKASKSFGIKPWRVSSDDDDQVWVIFRSTPEKIYGFLDKFGIKQPEIDENFSFKLDSISTGGWVRDKETLEESGWLEYEEDYRIPFNRRTLDLDKDYFEPEEDGEAFESLGKEKSFVILEDEDEGYDVLVVSCNSGEAEKVLSAVKNYGYITKKEVTNVKEGNYLFISNHYGGDGSLTYLGDSEINFADYDGEPHAVLDLVNKKVIDKDFIDIEFLTAPELLADFEEEAETTGQFTPSDEIEEELAEYVGYGRSTGYEGSGYREDGQYYVVLDGLVVAVYPTEEAARADGYNI